MLAFALVAVLAPALAPYPAGRLFLEFLNRPQPASFHGGHLLGTDVLGHDTLSQLLYGIRETMFGSLLTAAGATAIGVIVGSLAGYYGGILDAAIGWLTGLVLTMPALAVVVLVVIYNAPVSPQLVGLTLTGYLWTGVSRAVRANVAALRVREFVEAAYAAGASDLRVILRHLLPNSAGVLLVAGTAVIGQSILIIATVDFFDYGTQQAERPTLGGLVATAVRGSGLAATPWRLYLIPAVALGLLLVSINVTADTLEDALEPAGRT